MTDTALRWIPRFVFGEEDLQLTYPVTRWSPGARTVGSVRKSGTGTPGPVLRLRKDVLSLTLRFLDTEWDSVRSLIDYGQFFRVIDWYPGDDIAFMDPLTPIQVYLDAPRVGDGIRPQRDGSLPWLMTLGISLTRVDGQPWDLEYFKEPPTGPTPVDHIIVTLDDSEIEEGETTQATAVVYDADDNVLDYEVTWSTTNSHATVDGDGLVTAVSFGTVTVRATSRGVAGGALLTVDAFPGYYRELTIDKTKCGTADTADFVMLFTGTYAYLKTLANGGKVERADGFDIVFRSAAGALLDFWIEAWDGATGDITAWIRVPLLTFAVDSVIRLYYGNTGISTDQSDADGTYEANTEGIWPFGSSAVVSVTDKSGDGNNLTNAGATAVAGQIRGGVTVGVGKSLSGGLGGIVAAAKYSYELWWRADNNPGGAPKQFVRIGTTSDSAGLSWSHNNATFLRAAYQQNAASVYFAAKLTTVVVGGTWYHIVVTWDGANLRIYLNGVLEATTAVASLKAPTGTAFLLGAAEDGRIDNVRLSKIDRSASDIKASYNNQFNPATFYAVGAETGA